MTATGAAALTPQASWSALDSSEISSTFRVLSCSMIAWTFSLGT